MIRFLVVLRCILIGCHWFYYIPRRKSGDILVLAPSRRRRRNFLVYALQGKRMKIFFSNLVHMLRLAGGRPLLLGDLQLKIIKKLGPIRDPREPGPLLSPLLLDVELRNILGGIGKPYVESLNSRSDFPLDPPLGLKLGS